MISGIYSIRNLLNGNEYIGSSYNINKRLTSHKRKLNTNKHHSKYLQNAWNKYGKDNFEYLIIEECKKEILLDREQFYIENRKPKYNMSKKAGAPMAGRKHSKEALKKMAKTHIGNKYNLGHKWSKEQREKIINRRTGSKRSLKTKRKMSKTAKRINAISRVDRTKSYKKIIDSNGIVYESLSKAAKLTGHSIQAICDNLKGRSVKTRRGLVFKYV